MLISFKVENFRSIREEQEFSFVASADESLPQNTFAPQIIAPRRLLRSAALYGANASGKSNFLKAISFAKWMVTFSQTRLESSDTPINISPFSLDPKWASLPSKFEIQFIQNDTRASYGFVVTQREIEAEWLDTFPLGKRRQIFIRKASETHKPQIEFGPTLEGTKQSKQLVSEATRKNSLVLSAAAQTNFKELSVYYEWFAKHLMVIFPDDRQFNILRLAHELATDDEMRKQVVSVLSMADVGIKDVRARSEQLLDTSSSLMRKYLSEEFLKQFEKLKDEKSFSLEFVHKGQPELEAWGINDESRGTTNLVALLFPLISSLRQGNALFIDELSASLHPHVGRSLIEYWHASLHPSNTAQLTFASHDATLLDSRLLRRDQIWFVEKDNEGASHIYPLSDFHPRKDENLARGYLQGRYGAIPLIGLIEQENDSNTSTELDRTW